MKCWILHLILITGLLSACQKSDDNTQSEEEQALPATTSGSATNITSSTFTANWQTVAGASKYLLFVSADAAFTRPLNGFNPVETTGTNYTVTGLEAGTNYYYKVQTATASKTSVASNVITATTSNKQWMVTTFAGSTTRGYADGAASTAKFYGPRGLVIDNSGNLYVTDQGNNRVRKITPLGEVSTVAGNGTAGTVDGNSGTAQLNLNGGITIDAQGNLYVTNGSCIRKITSTGTVSTFAGAAAGTNGLTDGQGTAARFNGPRDITSDAAGNLYVADTYNNAVRKITTTGNVSTIASSTSTFSSPLGITYYNNNLYVTNQWLFTVLKVSLTGNVQILAGRNNTATTVDGAGTSAGFSYPTGITSDNNGNLFVIDAGGSRTVRKITPPDVVSSVAGGINGYLDGPATSARFSAPFGIAVDAAGNMYIADEGNNCIRKISYQ